MSIGKTPAMKTATNRKLILLSLVLILMACQSISTAGLIQTAVSGTQTAQAGLPPAGVHTAVVDPPPVAQVETSTLPATTPDDPPAPSAASSTQGGIGQEVDCNAVLLANVRQPPEMTKDLFEHHAVGTFLIVLLEMRNLTSAPIQIWDGDYLLEGLVNNERVTHSPQRAATGYLFITRGNSLSQDKIQPGQTWKTYLAFDVSPEGSGWELVVTPGKEGGQQLCEIRIRLTD